MHAALLFLSFMAVLNNASAQADSIKTEVCIIGTIHHGNKHFNYKTLYNVVKQLDPDIILWEQSIKYKRVLGLRTATRLKIAKPGIEQLALQKYTRYKKDIKVFPYDTLIVSRRKYLRQSIKTDQNFFDSLHNVNKSAEDSIGYAAYVLKRNSCYEFISDTTLGRINKPDVVNRTRELYYLEQSVILPMGKKYVRDTQLVQAFENELTFWVARNDFMVKQVSSYAQQFAGKKIIVLAGLNHKYYLQDKLTEDHHATIKIKPLELD